RAHGEGQAPHRFSRDLAQWKTASGLPRAERAARWWSPALLRRQATDKAADGDRPHAQQEIQSEQRSKDGDGHQGRRRKRRDNLALHAAAADGRDRRRWL